MNFRLDSVRFFRHRVKPMQGERFDFGAVAWVRESVVGLVQVSSRHLFGVDGAAPNRTGFDLFDEFLRREVLSAQHQQYLPGKLQAGVGHALLERLA